MKKRKVPLRKCIACGENKPKKELIRVVRDKESIVSIDLTGRANGRGAYICSDLECLELAKKGNKLSRALEAEVSEELYDVLKSNIESNMEK